MLLCARMLSKPKKICNYSLYLKEWKEHEWQLTISFEGLQA